MNIEQLQFFIFMLYTEKSMPLINFSEDTIPSNKTKKKDVRLKNHVVTLWPISYSKEIF